VERDDETYFGDRGSGGHEDCLSDQVIHEIGEEKCFGGQVILKRIRSSGREITEKFFSTRFRRRGDEKILAAPSSGKEVVNKFLVTVDRGTGHDGVF
jgi:hypothetical protein